MLPFLLQPYLKKVIWGGSSLATFKGLSCSLDSVGESWEVSAMPGCESIVASGEFAGTSLADLCRSHGRELLGDADFERRGGSFPLLIKFIDAADDLSVQVHPTDELAARRHGCLGKNEMWYIIATQPGSRLAAGFRHLIDIRTFERSVADGSFNQALAWHDTHPGDAFYIPTGCVHAIGRGNLLLEVQQPSDITYRIYDYDRRDAAGNRRPLAIAEARGAIDYTPGNNYRLQPVGAAIVATPHFSVWRRRIEPDCPADVGCDMVTAVLVVEGAIDALCDGHLLAVGRGHTLLIPAGTRARLCGDGVAIVVTP